MFQYVFVFTLFIYWNTMHIAEIQPEEREVIDFISIIKHRVVGLWFITLRPRHNGYHFPKNIFRCIFLNEYVWILVKIPNCPINNIATLVLIMAWHQSGDMPLSEPMMVRLLMHICITLSQSVKISAKAHFKLKCWTFYLPITEITVVKYNHCHIFQNDLTTEFGVMEEQGFTRSGFKRSFGVDVPEQIFELTAFNLNIPFQDQILLYLGDTTCHGGNFYSDFTQSTSPKHYKTASSFTYQNQSVKWSLQLSTSLSTNFKVV